MPARAGFFRKAPKKTFQGVPRAPEPKLKKGEIPPPPPPPEVRAVPGHSVFENDRTPIPGKTPQQVGAWETVRTNGGLTTGIDIGAQAVQSALLPNGVILVVNGSSNRDGINPLRITDVQNTVLFNPATLQVLQIPATPEPQTDATPDRMVDPFCGGHNHLPDGRVLFVGGTKRYDMQGTKVLGQGFLGTQEAWIFDWTKIQFVHNPQNPQLPFMKLAANPWVRLTAPDGLKPALQDGRWYPSVVTLGDGKLAIWGGFTQNKDLAVSQKVEIFDPAAPDTKKAWTVIDWTKGPRITPNAAPTDGNNGWSRPLDLYARILLMPDGRLFLPGDGVGMGNRGSHTTFYAQINLAPGQNQVLWDFGDTRKPVGRPANKFYGTALHDPRPSLRQPGAPGGDLLIIGGGVGDIDLADGKMAVFGNPGFRQNPNQPDRTLDNTNPALRVTADLDTYTPPLIQRPLNRPALDHEEFGLWKSFENFLGDGKFRFGKGRDSRINHVSVLLPTGEILVVGGGSYGYGNPQFFPQLLTPHEILNGAPVIEDAQIDANVAGFRRRTAAPHQFPRLYHTSALLIPDGRVVLMGGNPYRATVVRRQGDSISREGLSFENDFNKGFFGDQPAEEHLVEIYRPPYLFRGPRPVVTGFALGSATSLSGPPAAAFANPFAARAAQPEFLARAAAVAAAAAPLPLGPTGIPLLSRQQTLELSVAGLGDLSRSKVTAIKLGSVTHSADVGAKFIRLAARFSPLGNQALVEVNFPNQVLNNVTAGKRTLNQVPVGMNTAPVGTYMIFVLNENNVPSEAKMVELTN